MKISSRGRYALSMMIDIAEHRSNAQIPIKDISERQGLSVKYLEQIVTNLTRSGLLHSERGSGGGYRLTKSPDKYTVGEILRAVEGKLAPVTCLEDDINQCEHSSLCKTLDFWEGLYKVIGEYVDSVTLQDFLPPVAVQPVAVQSAPAFAPNEYSPQTEARAEANRKLIDNEGILAYSDMNHTNHIGIGG